MDSPTFRSRVIKLLQKSRKALRLYSSVGRLHADGGSAFTDSQAQEWKGVNAELLRHLTIAIESSDPKRLTSDIFSLRDRFGSDERILSSELQRKQRDLMFAAENGDFVKCAILSNDLVTVKARAQATQAVFHELDDVIRHSRVGHPTDVWGESVANGEETSELAPIMLKEALDEIEVFPAANVIPLRRRS